MASIGSIAGAVVQGRRDSLEQYGDQLLFYVKALAWTPRAIRRYPREIVNTLAEVTFGAGGLSLIAGTVGVIAFLAFFAGTEVGIQGYASLSQIGVAKFSAFISAYLTPARWRRWSPRSRWPPPWAAATPRGSVRCGSRRRSTRSR